MLHRAVLQYGDAKHNQTLFHYHQACAAEILNHKIKTLGQLGPDKELFEEVSLFFFSQIQASLWSMARSSECCENSFQPLGRRSFDG
jgi:hypothetical protein